MHVQYAEQFAVLSISFKVDAPTGTVGSSLLFKCQLGADIPGEVWMQTPQKMLKLRRLEMLFSTFSTQIWVLRTIKIKTVLAIIILCLLQQVTVLFLKI